MFSSILNGLREKALTPIVPGGNVHASMRRGIDEVDGHAG
jgi:hypothetical protein